MTFLAVDSLQTAHNPFCLLTPVLDSCHVGNIYAIKLDVFILDLHRIALNIFHEDHDDVS